MEYQEQSLGGQIFNRIRDDILSGNYTPGEELKEATLGKQLGVSRTPVREALRQLDLEGLVEIAPNRGAKVIGISRKDVEDIYHMRARLEGLAARKAAEQIKEEELADIIYRYGEERWSKRIAQFIVKERSEKPIKTTFELVNVIKKAIPKGARQDGPHPAKRTFQAIRIEVNDELNILENVVTQAVERLKSGGRIGVITFHSLEDRIVKQTLAQLAKGCICPPQLPVCVCGRKPLVKKVGNIVPSDAEIEANPRSRSARLRYAIKR